MTSHDMQSLLAIYSDNLLLQKIKGQYFTHNTMKSWGQSWYK